MKSFIYTTIGLTSVAAFLLFFLITPHARAKANYNRSAEEYTIPDVTLINQDGEPVNLPEYLKTDKTVILEFIFSTCNTICPILAIGFTNLQVQLGTETEDVRLVSISIDPEHDTPPVMKEYLRRYQAQPGWVFLTGDVNDIIQTMRAFDAYVSDKMGHRPLTFLRSPNENKWVRITGLMSGKELKAEYRRLKNE